MGHSRTAENRECGTRRIFVNFTWSPLFFTLPRGYSMINRWEKFVKRELFRLGIEYVLYIVLIGKRFYIVQFCRYKVTECFDEHSNFFVLIYNIVSGIYLCN